MKVSRKIEKEKKVSQEIVEREEGEGRGRRRGREDGEIERERRESKFDVEY
jgi:predicted transposase YdaD